LISKLTNGAFDITVGPLIDLWGFGNSNQNDWEPPSEKDVSKIHQYIGFRNVEIDSNSIRKLNFNTTIDLNAIAKGFGVDVVFELLNSLGYKDILVEIGGEIRCSGKNQNGEYWRVGIDKPIFDILPGTDLQELISLNNIALATSGDYRNYFYYNDVLYSHTINPLTGYPVENGIASASVIAPNCMLADALATALMVMGVDGLSIIEKLEGIDALIVERVSEKEFKSVSSSGWNSG
jgi:thiamine biosynthesis lipoprotein